MDVIGLISAIIGTIAIITFFVIAYSVSEISSTLREMKEEQQRIYKAIYQIAKMQMDERDKIKH